MGASVNHGEQKRIIGERALLRYYNRVMFERGMITEDERNRMDRRIDARSGMTAGNTWQSGP